MAGHTLAQSTIDVMFRNLEKNNGAKPLVELDGLEFRYGGSARWGWPDGLSGGGSQFVLGPLSVKFSAGVTCLVGQNGAGKSTLLNLIVGLLSPSSGSVAVQGGRGVGYMPQQFRMPPRATCREFLDYAAWLHRVHAGSRPEATATALEAVGLSAKADARAGELSGGMQRRLGAAQAIVHKPGVVVLDEPTSGLDPFQRASLRELIPDLAQDRLVLLATHLVEDVRALNARVVVLVEGGVVFDGAVAELEQLDDHSAPGDSSLERAASALMRTHH